jgi:hypothetical protein
MFDAASSKLISGFLGLLILGFVIFILVGSAHIDGSELSETTKDGAISGEISNSQ